MGLVGDSLGDAHEPPPSVTASWSTEDVSYDRAKFYCHSTDRKGHSEPIRAPLPPTITAKMSEIIQSKRFPDLRSVQDIIRDAVYHRLHDYAEFTEDNELKQLVAFEMRASERARRMYWMDRQDWAIKQVEQMLQRATELKDNFALIEATAKGRLDAVEMIEPYRTRMLEVIDKYEIFNQRNTE